MRYFGQTLFLLLFTSTILSCDKTGKRETLTQADSLWINFMTQMENKNVDFLIENSLDTIQCVDCDITSNPETEFYDAELVFINHLDKLKHLKSLRDQGFTTYEEDNMIRVNYSFPATFSQDRGYNLIFTFIKVDDKYLFTGMIVT
jgi:hypothetical protein